MPNTRKCSTALFLNGVFDLQNLDTRRMEGLQNQSERTVIVAEKRKRTTVR